MFDKLRNELTTNSAKQKAKLIGSIGVVLAGAAAAGLAVDNLIGHGLAVPTFEQYKDSFAELVRNVRGLASTDALIGSGGEMLGPFGNDITGDIEGIVRRGYDQFAFNAHFVRTAFDAGAAGLAALATHKIVRRLGSHIKENLASDKTNTYARALAGPALLIGGSVAVGLTIDNLIVAGFHVPTFEQFKALFDNVPALDPGPHAVSVAGNERFVGKDGTQFGVAGPWDITADFLQDYRGFSEGLLRQGYDHLVQFRDWTRMVLDPLAAAIVYNVAKHKLTPQ